MSKWNPEKLKNHKGMLGKKHSFDVIERMKGEGNNAKTPQARLKMSLASKGKKKSLEHIGKIKLINLGRKTSAETRLKQSIAQKKIVADGKHHLWKDGIDRQNKTERQFVQQTIEYKLWHKSVLERDNFTCQVCGHKGSNLHVDHVKPFALFPDLRVAIDNGRTLCASCHRKTETYGRRLVTKAT